MLAFIYYIYICLLCVTSTIYVSCSFVQICFRLVCYVGFMETRSYPPHTSHEVKRLTNQNRMTILLQTPSRTSHPVPSRFRHTAWGKVTNGVHMQCRLLPAIVWHVRALSPTTLQTQRRQWRLQAAVPSQCKQLFGFDCPGRLFLHGWPPCTSGWWWVSLPLCKLCSLWRTKLRRRI